MTKTLQITRYIILFILVFALVRCKESIDKKVLLKKRFTFITATRPSGFSFTALNHTLVEQAEKSGRDSVVVFEKEMEQDTPNFVDIEFFPILGPQELLDLSTMGYGNNAQSDHKAEIGQIDFSTQFVLLVAHPSSTPPYSSMNNGSYAQYLDELYLAGSSGRTLMLSLDSSVLGASPQGIEAIMQKWDAKVFFFDKKEYDRLSMILYEQEYHFDLSDKIEEKN